MCVERKEGESIAGNCRLIAGLLLAVICRISGQCKDSVLQCPISHNSLHNEAGAINRINRQHPTIEWGGGGVIVAGRMETTGSGVQQGEDAR